MASPARRGLGASSPAFPLRLPPATREAIARLTSRTAPRDSQHNWPGHILKKRYLKLKKDVPGSAGMSVRGHPSQSRSSPQWLSRC
jgi:hypothetical protein